jgi:hypothetical protein
MDGVEVAERAKGTETVEDRARRADVRRRQQ